MNGSDIVKPAQSRGEDFRPTGTQLSQIFGAPSYGGAIKVAIRCVGLTRMFGNATAVDHVDLEVKYGEVLGLIGPNGAGKSTLMKMLTTLLAPTSGSATVAGYDLSKSPTLIRREIGYVPQLLSVDRSLTGEENMLLSARLYGLRRNERRKRIENALARMGLTASSR